MENKDYMKILRLLPVLCLLAFTACKDDNKFTRPGGKTVMEELKSNPKYSTFAYVMEQTGMDKVLFNPDKPVLVTIWVPLDDDMPAEVLTLTKEEQIRMLNNHISLTAINTLSLDDRYPVAAMSGRHMPVDNKSGIFYVDGAGLLNTDIACSNGMIHEISEWFLPRVTLYDYVMSLSGDYSIFRDSILGRNVVTFDKDSSSADHVDGEGRPDWTPVYKTSNNILDYAKLNDITVTRTLFIPTNEAIAGMYRDMGNYLLGANYLITAQDSSRWMDWLMRACIQPGNREYRLNMNFAWTNDIWKRSDSDEEKKKWEEQSMYTFRTKFQQVYDATPKRYLNGRSYVLNKISVPKTMYVKKTEFNPWSLRNEAGGMNPHYEGMDWWVGNIQANVSGPKTSPANSVFIQFGRPNVISDATEPAYYAYKSAGPVKVEDEETGETSDVVLPLPVMPGYYDIGIRLNNLALDGMNNATDSVTVKINGQVEFKVKGIVSGMYGNDDRIVIQDIKIPGQYEPVTIEIHLFPTDEKDAVKYLAYRRIQVGKTRLIPTIYDSNF